MRAVVTRRVLEEARQSWPRRAEEGGDSYGQLFPDGRQRAVGGQRLGAREDVWGGRGLSMRGGADGGSSSLHLSEDGSSFHTKVYLTSRLKAPPAGTSPFCLRMGLWPQAGSLRPPLSTRSRAGMEGDLGRLERRKGGCGGRGSIRDLQPCSGQSEWLKGPTVLLHVVSFSRVPPPRL